MPASEFNYDALGEFLTSSRDSRLQDLAKVHGMRYVGSTSSMSSVLSHFHFLLSQWREINVSTLSKAFPNTLNSFTVLSRAPQAIFLKWQNGTYAIDADKEFAYSNLLSMLGRSMEKLLTLDSKDFERYRKNDESTLKESKPESYHYTTMGDFLMRSQLDAHDSRLPGTGMFDLKTRAVVSVRMDSDNPEMGSGYEIKNRFGEWESYEREYYDMVRATMLKYSLQVRMGRMDGIFVAYHNTQRIFGFQYVSLPELDLTLHGQEDTQLGDSEFKISLDLLNKLLNRATEKYPGQVSSRVYPTHELSLISLESLRLHFETREAQTTFMYVFAEPVTDEQLCYIQDKNNAKVAEIERTIMGFKSGSEDLDDEKASHQWSEIQASVEETMDNDERSLVESGSLSRHKFLEVAEDKPDIGSESQQHEMSDKSQFDSHQPDFAALTASARSKLRDSKSFGEQSALELRDHEGPKTMEQSEAPAGSARFENMPPRPPPNYMEREEAAAIEPSLQADLIKMWPESEDQLDDLETRRDDEEDGAKYLRSPESTAVPDVEVGIVKETSETVSQQDLLPHAVEHETTLQETSMNTTDPETVYGDEANGPNSVALLNPVTTLSPEAEILVKMREEGFEEEFSHDSQQPDIDPQPGPAELESILDESGMAVSQEAPSQMAPPTMHPEQLSNSLDSSETAPSNNLDTPSIIQQPPNEDESAVSKADTAFLNEIVRESEVKENTSEILGMVLTIRNKVNGGYVLRPTKLGVRDDWTVEYTLEEVSGQRAWSLYEACKLRRKKALEMSARTDEQAVADYYLQQMRHLSREGKKYRKKLDMADKDRPVVVYGSPSSEGNTLEK